MTVQCFEENSCKCPEVKLQMRQTMHSPLEVWCCSVTFELAHAKWSVYGRPCYLQCRNYCHRLCLAHWRLGKHQACLRLQHPLARTGYEQTSLYLARRPLWTALFAVWWQFSLNST